MNKSTVTERMVAPLYDKSSMLSDLNLAGSSCEEKKGEKETFGS